MREPVSRLVSFYLHIKQRGEIAPNISFFQALSQKKTLHSTALYYSHLSRWIDIFGTDNVRVLFFEELNKDPINFASQLCSKLGIELENTFKNLQEKINANQAPINHHLSSIVYRTVNILHDVGLHKIVDYGKNIGIKQLIASKKGNEFKLTNSQYAHTFNLLKKEVLPLETNLNLDLYDWKKIWVEKGIDINFIEN